MTGPSSANEGMTKDEAQVYDRQIRLWGFEAQEKLRTSSVLVYGLSGLGAEVVKNLMLCGLKAIVLMDDKQVTDFDYDANFLLSPDSIGKNRATCSAMKAQALNPMVDCTVQEVSIDEKDAQYIDNFNLIIFMDQPYNLVNKWDKICREKGTGFIAGSVFGWMGYGFFDFNNHYFLMAKKKSNNAIVGLDGAQGADGNGSAITLDDDQLVKEKLEYASYEDAFNVNWQEKLKKKVSRIIPASYPPLRAMLRAQEIGKLTECEEENISTVYNLWDDEVARLKVGEEFTKTFSLEKFEYFFGTQLSPVCAAVGGLIGQEAIKALSENKQPLRNIFIYSAFETAGVMIRSPPQ